MALDGKNERTKIIKKEVIKFMTKDKKSEYLMVKISLRDKQLIETLAVGNGMTMSTYIRWLVRNEARKAGIQAQPLIGSKERGTQVA
jgi:hypothetical protein